MFENLRSQNSTYPLHGRVLVGRGRADVVAEAVPFADSVEGDKPTMAVTSSVVVEDVAVAFCRPEVVVVRTMPGRPLEKSAEYVLVRVLEAPVIVVTALLGIGVFDDKEEDCAIIGVVSSTNGKRSKVKENMRTMRCERMTKVLASKCYAKSAYEQYCTLRLLKKRVQDRLSHCHCVGGLS